MTTPVEKRNASKFYEFHGEVRHTTDECMHLKRQIEEMLKVGKLSHLIKELKQSNGKDQEKAAKKGETSGKDKPLAILMVQPWQRVAKQRITQTFSPELVTSFPTLGDEDGMEGPKINEAEMGGHFVYRMYVDGGSSSEILYEHCFNRFRPKVRNQMIPETTLLVGFSGEIIWPLGQISLLVKIGDEEHSTSAWMNFMVVRSPSPYNGIIRRPGVSSRNVKIPRPGLPQPVINQVIEEKIQVAIHPKYPEQTIAIGSTLTEDGRKELCGLLRRNLDIAWRPTDLTRVPRHIAEHMLNIREGCLPVRQKKRGQAPERNKEIREEVKKLVDAAEAEMAFKQMKKSIAELYMLTAPKEIEELIMYLVAAKEAISAVLMMERDGKQVPIYFVSRALQGLKINYTPMEKLILALILSIPEVTGMLLKWSFKLEEHDIHYRLRTSVKGQILADFIVEHLEDDSTDTPIEDKE
ncbi:reverse transcriptase domain-containing protein [Tanacetum coccineum]